MKRVLPDSFSGPRAYFTDFDHRIVARTRNKAALRRRGERRLKALLLLKGHIVCAASHLASRFAFEFFQDNSVLLTSGAVTPALRVDKTEFAELFTRKRFPGKDDAAKFYQDHVQAVVSWELGENTTWFRDRFLADIEDAHSVIRRHLDNDARGAIQQLVTAIRSGVQLERGLVDRTAKELSSAQRRLLLNYRELLYHMSGARVINCESALPQENYIEYDLADLKQKRSRLSDDEVLHKLVIELVLDSMQREMLPVEFLDVLSFEDILAIRAPIMRAEFQKKYDSLLQQAISSHTATQHKIYDVEELEQIRISLAETFDRIIKKELRPFMKRRLRDQAKELASVGASMAITAAGAIPMIGPVVAAYSYMKDTPALIVNIGQTYRSAKSVRSLELYYENKASLLRTKIRESFLSGDADFHEMVELLLHTVSERIRI